MQSQVENKLEINIIGFSNDNNGHKCGYCNKEDGSFSFGTTIIKYPVEIYEKMMLDGWRRCGNYVYIPNIEKSCCKLYTCKLNVLEFKINKEQKKVMKRFRKYLSGEYELNKDKTNQKDDKKKGHIEMKNIDEIKEKIEKILKEYLNKKQYIEIIEKYIKIDKNLLNDKLKELHVRTNTNKKFNFHYSIDLIYIINKIIETFTKKNNIKFDDIKKLDMDLFHNFKECYNSDNEELELFEKTGHINITDKTKPKKVTNVVENKIIEKKEKKEDKKKKKEKKEKNKEKEKEKLVEKYSFEYFPEIVNEPEINLPLKHTYTCELTDKIQIDDEKFKVYEKYQINIHKETHEETTKESFDRSWGKTNLIDNINIKLPNDLTQKTKHPELYPKKYGTYNFIHRIDGKIVAVGIWDILPTCLSSVYLYYDTDYQFLDLGVFTAIREIEYIKSFHDLIDNNFKYYTMGFYCETVQKLRYKGFYEPTQLLDRFTMNYVYLKDVQNIIKDGKVHKLSDKPNKTNYEYYPKDQINKYINDLNIVFKELGEETSMNMIFFLNMFISKKFIGMIIEQFKRFLEIIPLEILNIIKFIAEFDL